MDSLISDISVVADRLGRGLKSFGELDDMPVAVYVININGYITYYNPAAESLWGRAPVLGVDKWCGSWDIFTADGKFIPHDKCLMADAIKQRRPIRGIQAIAMRPDGTSFRCMPFPTPLFDDNGLIVGAINILLHLNEEPPPAVYVPRITMVERQALQSAKA